MNKVLFYLVFFTMVIIAGCAGANISSSKWDSAITGTDVVTRCEQIDMRNNEEMKALFSKYDGWKLIYISEYTTGNKMGTDACVCFEHSK
jgi:hypothetical protein